MHRTGIVEFHLTVEGEDKFASLVQHLPAGIDKYYRSNEAHGISTSHFTVIPDIGWQLPGIRNCKAGSPDFRRGKTRWNELEELKNSVMF